MLPLPLLWVLVLIVHGSLPVPLVIQEYALVVCKINISPVNYSTEAIFHFAIQLALVDIARCFMHDAPNSEWLSIFQLAFIDKDFVRYFAVLKFKVDGWIGTHHRYLSCAEIRVFSPDLQRAGVNVDWSHRKWITLKKCFEIRHCCLFDFWSWFRDRLRLQFHNFWRFDG